MLCVCPVQFSCFWALVPGFSEELDRRYFNQKGQEQTAMDVSLEPLALVSEMIFHGALQDFW